MDAQKRILELCNTHTRFFNQNMVIPNCQICFYPRDVDFNKFLYYPNSTYNPKFLSRRAYLKRDEYKDDLKRLDAISEALAMYTMKHDDIYIDVEETCSEFFLPRVFKFGKRVKVPAGEKVILFGSPEDGSVCLFPGKITSTPEGSVYKSLSLDEASSYLDKKSNYSTEAPFLNLGKTETLESLKEKLINYLRTRIKASLQHVSDTSQMYRLEGNVLPIESKIERIVQGEIGPNESLLLQEFPLIFTSLKDEVTLYITEEQAIIEETNKYSELIESEDTYVLLNPILAKEEKDEKYNFPISVEMRALHINYAYDLVSEEPVYEDFLGDANWIIAPVTISKSDGVLHGKVSFPPYFCVDLFSCQETGEE